MENSNHITVSGNVDSLHKNGVNIYTARDFFMYEFIKKLRSKGIKTNNYGWKELPSDQNTVYIGHYSHYLTDLLGLLLKESDNLCAEAIF